MNRNKRNINAIGKKEILTIAIVSGLLVLVFIYKFIERHELLKNNSFVTLTTIEYLLSNTRKGTTSRKDVVYFCFQYNNTVIHKIKDLSNGAIKSYGIEVGDVFPVRVVKSNLSISEIDFSQKKDTILNFDSSVPHKYESEKHKLIIRMKSL